MTKRVALLGMHLEANAFAPVTSEVDFRALCYLEGGAILVDLAQDAPSLPAEIPAFAAAMTALAPGWTPEPIIVTAAEPGGPAEHGFFEHTLAAMRERLQAALPVDGVYVSAHGAMVTTQDADPDGKLLDMVRGVVGPDIPVIATLDLHANISETMVEAADILVSYRTNPHVDQEARAAEAASLMAEMWAGMKPAAVFIRLPLVAPTVSLLTARGPYADLINYSQQALAEQGDAIANVSVVAGFVYSNSAYNGLAVIVTGRGDAGPAEALAIDIAERAWIMRARFTADLTPLDEAVERARAAGADAGLEPVILADVADNPGGGGGGNSTWILRALVEAGAEGVLFGVFHDEALAQAAWGAGAGHAISATFNSRGETEFSKRFEADAEVLGLHDGKCVGRRGIWAGRGLDVGPSALIRVGGVRIVVVSHRKQCADPVLFEMFGLDIASARAVVVKSRGHFRAGFDEFFEPHQVIEVDAPGLVSPVLANFDFDGLPRPVYPLDRDAAWSPPA